MVNYYKILGIENYATVEEVRQAYKHKIRKYHPDLNSDPDATEITKYLNQAKDKLTDLSQKTFYDKQLKLAYLYEIARLKSGNPRTAWSSLSILERRRKMAENQKLKEKKIYESNLQKFPFMYRMALLASLIASGLTMIYMNYFVNLTGNEVFNFVCGMLIFMASCLLIADQTYKYYWFRSMDEAIKFNYEKWIGRSLLFVLFLGPFVIFGVNQIRKSYLLDYEYELYAANINIRESSSQYIVYEYEIDDISYKKRVNLRMEEAYHLGKNKIIIKYVVSDPRISEIVVKEQIDQLKKPL